MISTFRKYPSGAFPSTGEHVVINTPVLQSVSSSSTDFTGYTQ